jgi:hypothetical protein
MVTESRIDAVLFGSALEFYSCTSSLTMYVKSRVPLYRPRPIERQNQSIYSTKQIYLYVLFFCTFIVLLCHALAALGFGSSLPFCAEKRSSLLHESEEIFVALLGKHPFVITKARRLSWCCAAVLRANTCHWDSDIYASSTATETSQQQEGPFNLYVICLRPILLWNTKYAVVEVTVRNWAHFN